MHILSINIAKGEISFNYKLFIKWLCRVVPFTILAYLICCVIVYRDCYVTYTVSPVNYNTYIYVSVISLIGAIIALVVNYKNISFKLTLKEKVSVDFKRTFFYNLCTIAIAFVFYFLLIGNTKLLYWGSRISDTILGTDAKSEALRVFVQIVLPPDAIMVSCMIGMFLIYSLTRYLFDKSILA